MAGSINWRGGVLVLAVLIVRPPLFGRMVHIPYSNRKYSRIWYMILRGLWSIYLAGNEMEYGMSLGHVFTF